ncbi:MAG: hypothetical protein AAF267_05635 [Deinococcota bacterium]
MNYIFVNICLYCFIWTGFVMAQQPSASPESSETYYQSLALEAICGADNISGDATGCQVCPASTDRAGEETYNLITDVYQGSFSTANQDELLVDVQGCEPRVNGITGMYLLRNTAPVQDYDVANYYTGAQGRTCDAYTYPDGIDRLLCQGGAVFQGFLYQSLDAVSYVNGTFESLTLASGFDASGACMSGEQLESQFSTDIPTDFPATTQIEIDRQFERVTYDSCEVVSREADATFNYTWIYQDSNWQIAEFAPLLDEGLSTDQYDGAVFQLQLTDLPSPVLLEFLDSSLDADTFIRTFTP